MEACVQCLRERARSLRISISDPEHIGAKMPNTTSNLAKACSEPDNMFRVFEVLVKSEVMKQEVAELNIQTLDKGFFLSKRFSPLTLGEDAGYCYMTQQVKLYSRQTFVASSPETTAPTGAEWHFFVPLDPSLVGAGREKNAQMFFDPDLHNAVWALLKKCLGVGKQAHL